MSQPGNADALELAGMRAVTEASRLWSLDIFDPPIGSKHLRAAECLEVISGIIQRNKWLEQPYRGSGPPQWCGMFAGDCWRKAGLDPRWLSVWFASTMRLLAWARYKNWNAHINPRPKSDDVRRCGQLQPGKPLPFEPRAGDIVIVGDGTPVEGDHITLCTSYSEARRAFVTISGNGGGVGPKGDSREGISQRDYFVDTGKYKALWIVRPAFGDLLAESGA